MAPEIHFLADDGIEIADLQGSGLGFFGAGGFGANVAVGFWQGRTFITDSIGTTQGPEVNNVKYLNAASGILGQVGTGIALRAIPNRQSTLNIRFTNDTPVQTQNTKLRLFDRFDPDNAPSGVTTAVAEIIHPGLTQTNTGSGSTTWQFPMGSGLVMTLANSPGTSGLSPNGPGTISDQHDWYLAISASPDSIGSKLFAAWVQTEYL